jgi:outer membrane protein
MKNQIALFLALTSGFALSTVAQTAPAPASPVKIAVVEFQAAIGQTNEFQRDFADLQKKFDPKRQEIKALGDEIDSLTKQLKEQGDKLNDAERASRAKTIEDKKKKAQRIGEDAQSDFQQAVQELFGGIASKVGEVLAAYARQQGYSVVLDVSQSQQAPLVLYSSPSTDITKAVLEAYNVKSGVPAPLPPPAPAAAKPSVTP